MPRRILLGLFVCFVCAWTMRWASPSVEVTKEQGAGTAPASENVTNDPIGKWSPSVAAPNPLSSVETASLMQALATIPNSAFKTQLLTLPERIQLVALESVAKLAVPKEDYASLRVSSGGDLYYVCDVAPRADHLKGREPVTKVEALKPREGVAKVADHLFALHSRPGAGKVLYLNFKGGTITGTQWNTEYSVSSYTAKAYDVDGNPGSFDWEANAIEQIWIQVSEDFAPFDIDVTTERPTTFTPQTGHVMFTNNKDANGHDMPSVSAGGVAFLSKFGLADYATKYSPAFVYIDRVEYDSNWLASTASHEFGHNLGLSHDGIKDADEYYHGHVAGSVTWGTIMGAGGYASLDQWSKGEYYRANNTQDDLAIIAEHLSYIPSIAPVELKATGVETAEGSSFYTTGVVRKSAEPVAYSIVAGAGPMKVSADVARTVISWWPTPPSTLPSDLFLGSYRTNLDLRIEVLDSAGTVVATAAPDDTLHAALEFTAEDKTYSVRLSSSGMGAPILNPPTGYTAYDSLGKFILSGSFVATKPKITSNLSLSLYTGQEMKYRLAASNFPTVFSAAPLPEGLSFDAKTGAFSGSIATPGNYSVHLTASNRWGVDEGDLLIAVNYSRPTVVSEPSSLRHFLVPGSAITFQYAFANQAPVVTYQWRHNGREIPGATTTSFSIPSATLGDQGWYDLVATNTAGSTYTKPLFVIYAPPQAEIVAWNTNGLPTEQERLGPTVTVSADDRYGFALRSDGIVISWGYTTNRLDIFGFNPAVDVIASGGLSAVLRADGSMRSWFYDSGYGPEIFKTQNVVGLRDLGLDLCLLRQDGTVVGAGRSAETDAIFSGLRDVVDLSGWWTRLDVLYRDGTYVSKGTLNNDEARPNSISGVLKLGTTARSSYVLKSNGTVVKAGPNDSVVLADDVVDLTSSGAFAIALRRDGTVVVLENEGLSLNAEVLAKLQSVVKLGGYCALRDCSGDATPQIVTQPADQAVSRESSATFSVEATGGTSYITYQWRKDGVAMEGAIGRSYTIDGIGEGDEGLYDVVIKTSKGVTTSAPAKLSLANVPVVVSQSPHLQTFLPPSAVDLFVAATGGGTLKYQWSHNALPIPGATAANLHLSQTSVDSAGAYSCEITDDRGSRRAQMFLRCASGTTQVRTFEGTSMQKKKAFSHRGVLLIPDHVVDLNGLATPIKDYSNSVHPSRLLKPVYDADYYTALYWDGTVELTYKSALSQQLQRKLINVIAILNVGFTCAALKSDGTVVCWNPGDSSIAPGPVVNQRVTAISGSWGYGLALLADGTVAAWGTGIGNQQIVPAGLNHVKRVFALGSYACAIKDTGEAVVWGDKTKVPFDLTHALKVNEKFVLYENGTVAATPDVYEFINTASTVYDISENGYLRDAGADKPPEVGFTPAVVVVGEGIDYVLRPTVATGNEDYIVQWARDGSINYNAKSTSLELKFVTSQDKGVYSILVSNDLGEATATLDLSTAAGPALTETSVINQIVQKRGAFTLSVSATGTGPLSYQWSKDGLNLEGEIGPSLQISTMTWSDAGRYRIIVSDTVGRSVRLFNVAFAPQVSELLFFSANNGLDKVPADLGPVTSAYPNWYTVSALKADGTVRQWGDSAYIDPEVAALKNQAVLRNGYMIDQQGAVTLGGDPVGWASSEHYVMFVAGLGLKNDGTLKNSYYSKGWRPTADIINIVASDILILSDGTAVKPDGDPVRLLNTEAPIRDAWLFNFEGTYVLRRNGEFVLLKEYPTLSRTVLQSNVESALVTSSGGNVNNVQTIDRDDIYSGPTANYANVSKVYSLSQYILLRDGEGDQPLKIAVQPKSVGTTLGTRATFSVAMEATQGAYKFQWRKGGVAIAGAIGPEYTIANVSSGDAGSYDVVITSRLGTLTSSAAALSLLKPPAFQSVPGPVVTVRALSPLHLAVAVSGSGPLSYRWYLDGVLIPEATSATYHKDSMRAIDAGLYRIEVTDANGPISRNILVVYEPLRAAVVTGYTYTKIPDSCIDARSVGTVGGTIWVALKTGKVLSLLYDVATEENFNAVSIQGEYSRVSLLLPDGTVWRRANTGDSWVKENASGNVLMAGKYLHSTLLLTADGSVVNSEGLPSQQSQASFVSSSPWGQALITRWNGSVVFYNEIEKTIEEMPELSDVGQAFGSKTSGVCIKKDGSITTWNLYSAASLSGKFMRIKWIQGYAFGQRRDGSLERITTYGSLPFNVSMGQVLSSDVTSYVDVVLLDKMNDVIPSITAQPVSTTQIAGTGLTLEPGISGADLTYQWYKDGAAIDGATSSSLVLPSIQTSDAGRYTVTATNAYGSVTSRAAAVSVGEVTPSRIKNMSVRASSGAGGSPLIVGFVMSGGAKNVLVRAIGPTLAAFGVSGVMPDPQLILHSSVSGSDVIVSTNDNWTDGDLAAMMSSTFASVGAFGLSDTASKDSSLFTPVDGSRTVHVSPITGTQPGVVLVEAYDAGTGVSPHLINVSARNLAGNGSDTLIAGFVIDGTQPKKVLIRGIGPTLKAFGVTGVLADPLLEVHTTLKDSNNQPVDTIVATNDNWLDEPGAEAAFTAAGAFALSEGAKDSAIVVTLPFGAYTAVVRGADGGTGEALVEVYEVP